jgi:RNA polymerase sigma-70 factor (ECF subfamily)
MPATESSPSFPPPPPEFTLTARAFEEQFDYVYRAMRRFGVGEPDVEDLVQEVFLVMWRRWAEYEPHRPLRPWLAGIAFHIAQKHLSRGRREVPRGEVDREDEAPHPDERLASARSRDMALQALSGLPPKQRVLLVMHDLDGIEMRQIAATLQVPLFTAYSRLRRARLGFTRLVEQLKRQSALIAVPAPMTATAVMDSERQSMPAPAEARGRARRQLRAWMAAPAAAPLGPKGGPPPPGAAGWSLPTSMLVAAAAVVVAAGGLLVTMLRPRPVPSRPVASAGGDPARVGRTVRDAARLPPGTALGVMASVVPPTRLQGITAGDGRAALESLGNGLSGYWRFDDGYGSTSARDLSAAGRDCRLHRLDPNGAWVPGALSAAIALERGFVECPQASQPVHSTTPMSVSAWVKIQAWGVRHVAVVTRPIDRGTSAQDYFNLGMLDGKLKVRSDFWNIRITARPRVPLGRWVHVAFTYDEHATLRLYMDGKEMGEKTSPRTQRQGLLSGPVFIGAGIDASERTDPGQQLTGAVDEVAIYDRTLTPAEISALAAGGQPRLSL